MNKLNKSVKSVSKSAKSVFLYPALSYRVVGAIYDVRNTYGSGQKELVYQNALAEELERQNIPFKREVTIKIISPVSGKTMGNYKLDFVVGDKIIVEAKAMKFTPAKIEQQLYSYLRSTQYEVGFLINFGSTRLYLKRILLTNERKKHVAKSV